MTAEQPGVRSGTNLGPGQAEEPTSPPDDALTVGPEPALTDASQSAVSRRAFDHPRLAFLLRERDARPEGVARPPRHDPGTAGPTSGQWGSG